MRKPRPFTHVIKDKNLYNKKLHKILLDVNIKHFSIWYVPYNMIHITLAMLIIKNGLEIVKQHKNGRDFRLKNTRNDIWETNYE